ncbi:hypothetical protein J6590_000647 [Homalodisca vitripennis]|nr:hypothetical protein J6590_000647 [Homalodisca vitripennis]
MSFCRTNLYRRHLEAANQKLKAACKHLISSQLEIHLNDSVVVRTHHKILSERLREENASYLRYQPFDVDCDCVKIAIVVLYDRSLKVSDISGLTCSSFCGAERCVVVKPVSLDAYIVLRTGRVPGVVIEIGNQKVNYLALFVCLNMRCEIGSSGNLIRWKCTEGFLRLKNDFDIDKEFKLNGAEEGGRRQSFVPWSDNEGYFEAIDAFENFDSFVLVVSMLLLGSSVESSYSASYSSSSSVPGQAPVTYTYTTGNAQAVASTYQPTYHYMQVYVSPQGSPPRRMKRQLHRTDASQQIHQANPPPGLLSPLESSPQTFIFLPFVSRDNPPAYFAPGFSKGQTSRVSNEDFPGESRSNNRVQRNAVFASPSPIYGPPGFAAGSLAGAQAQAAAAPPSPTYGPPAFAAGSLAGAQAQAAAAAPPSPTYGPPAFAASSLAGAQAQAAAAAPPSPTYGPPAFAAGSLAGAQAQAAAAPPSPTYGPPAFAAGAAPPSPTYGPPAFAAGSLAGAQAQAVAAPHFTYGPPASAAKSVASTNQFSSSGLANKEEAGPYKVAIPKPHEVYGLPAGEKDVSSGVEFDIDEIPSNLMFIPAFPGGKVPAGVQLSPPVPGGFIPPDGALLAPPAPIAIPSPK